MPAALDYDAQKPRPLPPPRHSAAPDQAGRAIEGPACGAGRPLSQRPAGGKTRSRDPAICRRTFRSACRPSWWNSGPTCMQAEANLHAASAQIGVAVANRLPNLTLAAQARQLRAGVQPAFHRRHRFLECRRHSGRAHCSTAARSITPSRRRGPITTSRAAQYRCTVLDRVPECRRHADGAAAGCRGAQGRRRCRCGGQIRRWISRSTN